MLQELLTLFPASLSTPALVAAGAVGVMAIFLWLAGAQISRMLVTLMMVGGGGWLGMMIPRWMPWKFSGAGTAVVGALVLGVMGYALERFWAAVMLGMVLALWAGLITWNSLHGNAALAWPAVENGTLPQEVVEFWKGLPGSVRMAAPFTAAAAFLGGLILGMIRPRVGKAMLWSVVGVTVGVGVFLMMGKAAWPGWLKVVPSQTSIQLVVLGVLMVLGTVIDWRLSRPARKRAESSKDNS